jgi:hypothetical protein
VQAVYEKVSVRGQHLDYTSGELRFIPQAPESLIGVAITGQ